MQLLCAEKLSKSYHSKVVLKNFSFSIHSNDRIALIGRNGTGKSTMLKILIGDEKPDLGSVQVSRNIVLGMLNQNLLSSKSNSNLFISPQLIEIEKKIRNVEEQLSESNETPSQSLLESYAQLTDKYHALGGHSFEHEMKAALAGLGLDPDHAQNASATLSGGERMRIELARLLIQKPDVLLLDEPTNHLDDEALEWLEEYLSSYGGAVILVSHDRYFIDRTCSRIFEIENNELTIYSGNYSAYIDQKKMCQDHLKRSLNKLEKELEHQIDVKQTMLSHRKMNSYHSREKKVNHLSDIIEKEKQRLGQSHKNMRFNALKSTFTGDPNRVIFNVKSISLAFEDKCLFDDASFYINAQDKIFLCGPNGCGKTSLIKLLMGHLQNFKGEILYYGSAKMAYMGQFVSFEQETLSVFDTLASNTDMLDRDIFGSLAIFGFTGSDIDKKVSVLSGGERSRLFLCLLLRDKPDILILDEPTNHLDIVSREILESALCDYEGAIIAVSHDRFFIDKCATGILGFIDSKILSFDCMSNYRKAFKQLQNQKRQNIKNIDNDIMNGLSKDLTCNKKVPIKINRAVERKLTAKRKERQVTLEKIIHELEIEIKAMESSFDTNTPPDTFTKYAQMQNELEQYFEEYLLMFEEKTKS